MATLHQLLSSDPRAAADCAALLVAGDEVLLVDAGVEMLGATGSLETLRHLVSDHRVHALRADVVARGLAWHAEQHAVALLSDRDWVDRVRAHQRVISWR
ncbi:MAG: hypothetical protein GTN86_05260 [Xanthomonadales bacterium]|nr:hypothetical protein [Xanthomonadales bacterium]NIN59378.1 hypothetical protein [Xanthomonadales bacterium]NIN74729.1 hypothetical protein [Xanthomonadales bacterium]NIO14865.1 hypothetical protein [Xanthomonadales bacterium]NIP11771.1 hypothetical protein [Xanthomonadales bacterium]